MGLRAHNSEEELKSFQQQDWCNAYQYVTWSVWIVVWIASYWVKNGIMEWNPAKQNKTKQNMNVQAKQPNFGSWLASKV
jgi:hypothetical protein